LDSDRTPINEEANVTMAANLQEILLAPHTQPEVTVDCLKLIDQEVADKSGISGTTVKVAYKTVKTFKPGYLQSMMERLLPDIVDNLQPYWEDFNASGASEFGDYLVKRSDEVSEALLSVTDKHAASSERPAILRAYRAVRGGAAKHIAAALPQVGALVQKYAA
jgi:hypothetical protein